MSGGRYLDEIARHFLAEWEERKQKRLSPAPRVDPPDEPAPAYESALIRIQSRALTKVIEAASHHIATGGDADAAMLAIVRIAGDALGNFDPAWSIADAHKHGPR